MRGIAREEDEDLVCEQAKTIDKKRTQQSTRREHEAKSKSQEEPERAKKNQGIEQVTGSESQEEPSQEEPREPREQRAKQNQGIA